MELRLLQIISATITVLLFFTSGIIRFFIEIKRFNCNHIKKVPISIEKNTKLEKIFLVFYVATLVFLIITLIVFLDQILKIKISG